MTELNINVKQSRLPDQHRTVNDTIVIVLNSVFMCERGGDRRSNFKDCVTVSASEKRKTLDPSPTNQ